MRKLIINDKIYAYGDKTFPNGLKIVNGSIEATIAGAKKEKVDLKTRDIKVGVISIINGIMYIKDERAEPFMYHALINALRRGQKEWGVLNFLNKIEEVDKDFLYNELFKFMNKNELGINDEGNIIAYKKIRNNWFDIHSNTVRYKIGDTPEMPKRKVDSDRNNVCSTGLHFCSLDYLSQFGSNDGKDRVVEVEIDPRDVVSIPTDYNNAKGRAAKMHVVREMKPEELIKPVKLEKEEIEGLLAKFSDEYKEGDGR
jgi:hypothetical protein